MDLTSLADAKANIMISINGLMISILIAQIASKVDANPWLYVPTSAFILGCLVSLIFAAFMLYRRRDIKRLFAYSSIEHMGIIAFAFG